MPNRPLLRSLAVTAALVATVGFAQSRTGAGAQNSDQKSQSEDSEADMKAKRRAANEAAAAARAKKQGDDGKKAGPQDEEEERKP